ncbi:glycoside hydrolase superfamily [Mycena maculata]|uniref:alpha-amylase n=1 Tax=Mycena maculata TaxID=230809 RepID=A0AAD7J6S2_9AGAR|nr:glycoside hydrolase superfamily [Mycena maculata]
MLSSFSNIVLLSMLSVDSAFAAGGKVFRRSSSLKAPQVIVQLFEWNWVSVAAECPFLGSAGYGYVQVSPPNEHITGSQWWTDYQPVSYQLTSKRGTRAQFANMVTTCAKYNVGIIADAVFNHMTSGSGTGFAGSPYTKYSYPAAGYSPSNFHYCNGDGTASNINNYQDAYNVHFCELVGLADLAQEQDAVRQIIANYLKDLLSLGVVGFRIDAAKHMVDADLGVIYTLVNSTYPGFYDTQEVIYGAGEAVQPSQYVTTGDVIEFRAPSSVLAYFKGSPGIAALVTPTPMGAAWGFVDSSVANYIMANQDTERNTPPTSLTHNDGQKYILSAIFMLAFNYGKPTVYSGYTFSDSDAGAPQYSNGSTKAVTCGLNGWTCDHRSPAIANMVAFHNAAGSAPLTNIQQGSSQQIAFGRGSQGFVAINNDAGTWARTFSTSLPAGSYCDIIHDTTTDPSVCNGPTYVVSASGTFSASIGPSDALALFTASPASTSCTVPPASTVVTITFDITVTSTVQGDTVKIAGSIPQFGSWDPTAAIPLSQTSSIDWTVTMNLPPGAYFECKIIRVSSSGVVTWESGSNRVYTTPQTPGLIVTLSGTFGSTTSGSASTSTPPAATPQGCSSSSSSASSSTRASSSSSAHQVSSLTASSFAASSPSTVASTKSSSSSATSSASSSSSTGASSTASPTPASTAVTVIYAEQASTGPGDVIKVASDKLGNWDPAAALPLSQPSPNADWTRTLTLPPGSYFQYKFIRVSSSGTVTWESGPNRVYTTPSKAGSVVTLYGIFGSTTSSSSAVTAGATPTTTSHQASTSASVTFSESATTASGEVVKLVGSIDQLGNWAPASAIALSNSNGVWSVTLALPPNTSFQYKFIRVKSNTVVWESDPNRSYTTLSQGSSVTLSSSFR